MKTLFLYLNEALFFALPIILCFALFSLVMLCVRWKSEHRGKHARRLLFSLASIPLIAGLIYCTTWFGLMPLMAKELTAEHDAARAKRFLETTLVKIGDRSPDFTLTTLAGENIAVPQQGKVTVEPLDGLVLIVISLVIAFIGGALAVPEVEQPEQVVDESLQDIYLDAFDAGVASHALTCR